jgi:tetratricopeptide (TPR) repeat protein
MTPEMQFCLLGPIVVRRRGTAIPVRSGQQRAILAMLLLDAGEVVPVRDLAGALWDTPPPSARACIRGQVNRLRQTVGESRVKTSPSGYLISVADGELDVARFQALLESARASARERAWERAAGQADEALALWRGKPLAGLPSVPLVRREAPRLAELRRQAFEIRIDADLRALTLFRELRDRHGEAMVLSRLGLLSLREGRHQQAAVSLRRALALFRECGDRQGEATMLARLGQADLRQYRHQQAAVDLQQALAGYRELADLSGQADALNSLGELLLATRRPAEARTQYAAALGLAREAGDLEEQARAQDGLLRIGQSR